MSTPQMTARRILRDAARTATLGDLWIATDEEDLEAPDPAGNPTSTTTASTPSCTCGWTRRPTWLTCRSGGSWPTAATSTSADEVDVDGAAYGDVSMRHVTGVSRAARARLAAIIEVALRMRGYDPDEFSIGGDPR